MASHGSSTLDPPKHSCWWYDFARKSIALRAVLLFRVAFQWGERALLTHGTLNSAMRFATEFFRNISIASIAYVR